MSEGYITSDIAARLLKIKPRELEKLADNGVIPREGKDKYILAAVVQSYVTHLTEKLGGNERLEQTELAARMDISDRRLRDLLKEFGMDNRKDNASDIMIAYIRKLREEAAGRSDKELSAMRARDAKVSAQLKELDLAEKLGQIIYVEHLSPALNQLVADMQNQILEAGNKILQSLENHTDVTIDDEVVNAPLRASLRNIAESAGKLTSSDGEESTESQSTAA